MRTPTLLLLAALIPAQAFAASKCVTPSGDVIFTDMDCPAGSQRAGSVSYQAQPGSGLRDGERAMLDRIERREAHGRYEKQRSRDFDRRHHTSYGDRKRIRELEMEKGQLSRSLSRGSKTYAEKRAIESQIIGLDRQIEQIRAPKW